MFKKIIAVAIVFSVCQMAQAKIIPLDNQFPDHCRQQITHGGDTRPVVLAYIKDCPWANKLLLIYEQVAKELPNRAFFTFEFSGDDGNDYLKAKTVHDCLGVIPLSSPSVYVFDVVTSSRPEYPGNINGAYKFGLDGSATKQDLIDFIGGNSGFKQTKQKASTNISRVYSPIH